MFGSYGRQALGGKGQVSPADNGVWNLWDD